MARKTVVRTFEVMVDGLAEVAIWHRPKFGGHGGVLHTSLGISDRLIQRIDAWIATFVSLSAGEYNPRINPELEWQYWDNEGWDIARTLQYELGPSHRILYFCETTRNYLEVDS